jgi:hypothetical protein
MAWSIKGRYFENCSCEVTCPCTISMSLGADYDRCNAVLIFHIESGEVDGVDLADRTVVTIIDTPKFMHEGGWRIGMLIDDGASDQQAEKLAGVFSGELGGPMELLGGLVGEMLGVERVPIEVSSENGVNRAKIGDGEIAVEDIVPFGVETGEPAKLDDIFHPAGSRFNIAKSTSSRLTAFGIDFAHNGKSGYSAPFAWSG